MVAGFPAGGEAESVNKHSSKLRLETQETLWDSECQPPPSQVGTVWE